MIELRTDEAYYWTWSKESVLSFLDHPPMIAWFIRFGTAIFGDTNFGVRFAGLVAMLVTQLLLADIVRRVTHDIRAVLLAVLMSEAAIYYGLLMAKVAPDVALIPFAVAMVWALVRLVESDDARWWLAAGVFAGLALLSKFTAVMLLPAVLAFMLIPDWRRRWLTSPYPWAAALIAVAVFSPVLIWNAQHDWASFRFQSVRAVATHELSLRTVGDFFGLQFFLVGPILLPVLLSAVTLTAWRGYRQRDAIAILLSTSVIVPFLYFLWKSLTLRIGDTWPMFLWPIGFAAAAINIAMLPREGWPAWMIKSTLRWAKLAVASGIVLVVGTFLYSDDRTDRLALVHQIESLVDLLEFEDVGDHRVDLNLSVHVPVDDFRHVGAAASAAERRTLPDPAGHQLERPCRDLLAGFGDPDHHRDAPAAMACLQRLPHHRGVAGAVEGEVGAAVGQRHQMLDDIAVHLLRIDEMGHAEAAAPFILGVVDVDADDLVGADHFRALDHVEADAAKPEHHDIRSRRDLGGVDHGADPGGDAAADVAALVERRVLADLCDRDFRQHGEIGKRRAAHIVKDGLALVAEPRGAVGHHALALGGADRGAEIGLLAEAAFALPAFRRVKRDDVIARLHRDHAGADLPHDSRALMTEDRRKNSLAVEAVEGIGVGMTDAGRLDLDQHFAGFRAFQIEFDDFQRFFCFKRDGGACLHVFLPKHLA